MQIKTRHFFFGWWRDLPYDLWWARSIRIGIGARAAPEYGIPYRVAISVDFWLIPNFIWYQDYLCQENGRPVYQTRIIGIQSWPFKVHIFRPERKS